MLKKITMFVIVIILYLLSGCKANIDTPQNNIVSENISQNNINSTQEEQINAMTLEEKIGQMIIAGFEGYAANENTKLLIEKYNVGGFILYSRNIQNFTQLTELINSLKQLNSLKQGESAIKAPLFISIDEEGGRISRMPKGIKKLPSSKRIGAINNEKFAYEIGSIIGRELRLFGFNMDFAPVLDISSNPNNPVIGDRSLGSTYEIVCSQGIEIMKGLTSENIISVIKHFPGHGDTEVDSHIGLPSVNSDIKRLDSFELIPFRAAIDNKTDAIMIAHILLPKIDADNPASLSEIVIRNILREQLNFEGVVITDDMTMGAIVKNYDIGAAAVKSVKAGSDIILVCHGYDNVLASISAIKNAVLNNEISEAQIDESVYRILKLKQKYKLNDQIVSNVDEEAINTINKQINNTLDKYLHSSTSTP